MAAVDSLAASTKLRREMIEVQAQLEAKRTEHRERMEKVRQREQALAKQKEQLQERLVKFYKLIQENDIKKTRADKKTIAEVSALGEKQRQVLDLMEQIHEVEDRTRQLHSEIERYGRYQKYLEDVIASSDEYQHPMDIILRHRTLESNNADLHQRKKALEEEVEEQKTTLQRRRKAKEDELLEDTNALSRLQDQLETTHKRTVAAADAIEASAEARANNLRTVGQVKLAVQNLYDQCVEMQRQYRRGRGRLHDDTVPAVLQQVSFIGDCLGDFIIAVDRADAATHMSHRQALQAQTQMQLLMSGASGASAPGGPGTSRSPARTAPARAITGAPAPAGGASGQLAIEGPKTTLSPLR